MFKKYYSLLIVSIFVLTVLAPYTTNADVAPLDINSQIYTNYGGGASAPIFTDSVALSDIQQAQRDASNLYNKAISSGVSKDVAQTQSNKILQAGIDRAKVKQENNASSASGGVWQTLTGMVGYNKPQNERMAALAQADQAYEKAQAEASTAVGDTKQAEHANAAAQGYQDVANAAKNGAFTTGGNSFVDTTTKSMSEAFSPQGKVYTLLAPIETFFPGGTVDIAGKGLSGYLDGLYKAGIAIATGLALIMIVIGGLQYVSTDAIGGKSEGRQRINNAIVGLLLALGSYILLQQINPALLKSDLNVEATKSTGKVNNVDIELSTGTTAPPPDIREGVDVSQMPYSQSLLNNINYSITGQPQAQYSSAPGSRIIGGGVVYIDYDGSPGAYKVAVSYPGKYTFRGIQYKSVGYEDLANAGRPGNWWGVKTDTGKTSGQPIINSDGTLIPVLSIGAGVINGDVTPFVALTAEQVATAKSKYGVSLTPNINTKVILTSNGKSIYATYADYAGSRALNYSEISPAAAKALGIDFGKRNGTSYAVGNVTISLP